MFGLRMTCERVLCLWIIFCFAVFEVDYVSGGEGVRIKELRVPDVVLNGTDSSVVLDCDYVLDIPAKTSGLVVKWFFNKHPAPVYQWIYAKKPQDLGVLKGKVNLNYKATNEESTMYRAIQIVTPTTELSGDYECKVSTFDKEDSRSKKMIIYVPEKSLELRTRKLKADKVEIFCEAQGVYPEPKMTITALESSKTEGFKTGSKKMTNSSLYEVNAWLTADDANLPSPTTFTCELTIPEANYHNKKSLAYYPGPPTPPPLLADSAEPVSPAGASGSTMRPSLLALFAVVITSSLRSL